MARSLVVIPYPPGEAHLEDILHRLTERITEGVEADARRNWDAHIETGKTRASVHAEHYGRTGRVWVAGRVWHFVEYGTTPHLIRSHDGGPLANRKTGFFAPSGVVNHPGNREFAPMRHAAYRKRDVFGNPLTPSLFGGL